MSNGQHSTTTPNQPCQAKDSLPKRSTEKSNYVLFFSSHYPITPPHDITSTPLCPSKYIPPIMTKIERTPKFHLLYNICAGLLADARLATHNTFVRFFLKTQATNTTQAPRSTYSLNQNTQFTSLSHTHSPLAIIHHRNAAPSPPRPSVHDNA